MTQLLYVNASPRGKAAASTQAAEVFLSALSDSVTVETLNLFDMDLPPVTEDMINAKFKYAMGAELETNEQAAWSYPMDLAKQFTSADHFLFALPMWNFSVPYIFKQYIDLITHPGVTFAPGENGMQGLASGSATVIYSRGGDYSPKDGAPAPFDFQSGYVKAWLGLVGLGPVEEVLVQNTLAGPEGQSSAVESASAQLKSLGQAVTP